MNPNFRYQDFASEYDTPNNIEYHAYEKNNWYFALFNYTKCYTNYYKETGSYFQIKKELEREDVNNICRKELDELRNAANNGLTYKEVNGHVRPVLKDYI
jgi:hypothetical protein